MWSVGLCHCLSYKKNMLKLLLSMHFLQNLHWMLLSSESVWFKQQLKKMNLAAVFCLLWEEVISKVRKRQTQYTKEQIIKACLGGLTEACPGYGSGSHSDWVCALRDQPGYRDSLDLLQELTGGSAWLPARKPECMKGAHMVMLVTSSSNTSNRQ